MSYVTTIARRINCPVIHRRLTRLDKEGTAIAKTLSKKNSRRSEAYDVERTQDRSWVAPQGWTGVRQRSQELQLHSEWRSGNGR